MLPVLILWPDTSEAVQWPAQSLGIPVIPEKASKFPILAISAAVLMQPLPVWLGQAALFQELVDELLGRTHEITRSY